MRVFVDSDVLIWHLRGQGEAKRLLGKDDPGSAEPFENRHD